MDQNNANVGHAMWKGGIDEHLAEGYIFPARHRKGLSVHAADVSEKNTLNRREYCGMEQLRFEKH